MSCLCNLCFPPQFINILCAVLRLFMTDHNCLLFQQTVLNFGLRSPLFHEGSQPVERLSCQWCHIVLALDHLVIYVAYQLTDVALLSDFLRLLLHQKAKGAAMECSSKSQ